jgi:hypothetical protein
MMILAIILAVVIACCAIPRYLKMLDAQYKRNSALLFAPDTCEELDPIPWIDDRKWSAAIEPPTVAELEAMYRFGDDDVR